LEEIYRNKRQNASVGRIIREKMGYPEKKSNLVSPRNDTEEGSERVKFGSPNKSGGFYGEKKNKSKKSVRIVAEGSDDDFDSRYNMKSDNYNFKSDNLKSEEENIFGHNLNDDYLNKNNN
jgi:hypothetical protein